MYTYSSEYEEDYNTLKEEFQEIIEIAQELDIEEGKYNVLIAFKNEMFKLIKEVMSDPIYTEDYVLKFLSNCNGVFINTWEKLGYDDIDEPETEDEFNELIEVLMKEFKKMLKIYFHLKT